MLGRQHHTGHHHPGEDQFRHFPGPLHAGSADVPKGDIDRQNNEQEHHGGVQNPSAHSANSGIDPIAATNHSWGHD
jgi:hypothetical protein